MSGRHAGLLAALASVWGGSYLLIKYALQDVEPGVIVFARTALAAVVLYAIIRARGGAARAALADGRRRPWMALWLGLVAVAAPFTLISFGELEVPSGLTAVLIAPTSLFVALFALGLDRSQGIDGRQAAGLVVGLGGVALLVGVESVQSSGQLLGALAMLGATACYGLATFTVRGAYGDVPTITSSFFSVTAAALLTAPLGLATLPAEMPGARAIASVVVLGVLGTAAAFVVYYKLIAEIGGARAGLVSYLTPPIALFYGALLLDEEITLAALAGLALILGGVFLASSGRSAPAPVAQPLPEARRIG